MKRLISLSLVMILALSILGLLACGGGQKEEAGTTTEEMDAPEVKEQTVPPKQKAGSEGCTWADMPIYPGAEEADQPFDGAVATSEEYTESHSYTSGDDLGKVAAFYKGQMPRRGWHLDKWMDVEMTKPGWTSQRGMYSMRDGQDVAVVELIDKGEGVAHIGLKIVSYNE